MTPPYLRRVWLDESLIPDRTKYPYCIPLLKHGLELQFLSPITIFVGENGVGKSTLIEAIAALAGYDESGGGKGYSPVDHRNALEVSGSQMARALSRCVASEAHGWLVFQGRELFLGRSLPR